MLPGFRFLLAATLLTISLLVFGLGAAALLRASHERFASLPAHVMPAPVFTPTADLASPTLSMLRIEPAPVEERPEPLPPPSGDTLMPTDKIATLSAAPRVELAMPPSAAVTAPQPEPRADIKPEPPTAEAKPEPIPDSKSPSNAPALDAPAQAAALDATPAEPIAVPPTLAAIEPATAGRPDTLATTETPAPEPEPGPAQQNATAIPDADAIAIPLTSIASEPPLVNATPVKRPPIPAQRPAAADVVAALSVPSAAGPALEAQTPTARKARPTIKRVARAKRRVVVRAAPSQRQAPAAANPPSPFGAPAFGASPFGT